MAHLLVVAHHHHPARHVEGDQRHHVGLARLVRDDHVEARGRLESFHRAGERHDPDRHRRSASVIFWLASTIRRGTRLPIPLPIRRTMSSHPTSACCC